MKSLHRLRAKEGVTQKTIAEYLGITQQAYANYESGKREPDSDMVCKLADYFHVTTDYLLGRDETNQPAANGGGLDEELVNLLVSLSPAEVQRAKDFVAGLKASRKAPPSQPPKDHE